MLPSGRTALAQNVSVHGKPAAQTAHLEIPRARTKPKFAKELFLADPQNDYL